MYNIFFLIAYFIYYYIYIYNFSELSILYKNRVYTLDTNKNTDCIMYYNLVDVSNRVELLINL